MSSPKPTEHHEEEVWDVEPLADTLTLGWLETPVSALSRLAALNAAGNAGEFGRDFFLSFPKIAKGDREEVRRFSILASMDFDELMRAAPISLGDGWFTLNGAVVSQGRSRRTNLRFCPHCAVEAVEAHPYVRRDALVYCSAPALVDPIRTCPKHCVPYVFIEDSVRLSSHLKGDYSLAIGDLLEDLDTFVASATPREFSRFERLLMGKLGYGPPVDAPLLNELSITNVTKICERMGTFQLHGPQALIGDLDDDGLWAAAEAGCDILARGSDGVRNFVSDAYERASDEDRRGLAAKVFGKFHYFINSEGVASDFRQIKQIVVDRLSELLPYGPDSVLYGVSPAKRYWHTLQSAEREYGIPARTIRRHLREADALQRVASGAHYHFSVPSTVLDSLYTSPDTALIRYEVVELTGAHAHDFAALEESGLLLPAVKDKVWKKYRFRRGDVEAVIEKLLASAAELANETDGFVPVREAHRNSSWSVTEIYQHIHKGKVPFGIVTGQKAIGGLRVHLASLNQLHPLHGAEHMTQKQVANLLKVSGPVTGRLATAGKLVVHLVRDGETKWLRQAFRRREVQEFSGQYISLNEILARRPGKGSVTNTRLASMRIWPAIAGKEFGATFYNREEVEKAYL